MNGSVSAIRLERIRRGLSIADISVRSGIDPATISYYERGKLRFPERYKDKIIAAVCGQDEAL